MTDGKRILLIEDEALIALDTIDALSGAGYEVVGPAASLSTAVAKAQSERIDGAVLDVNLGGVYVWPAAEVLAGRGIPFVIMTGFGAALDVPPAFAAVPRLGKPLEPRSLLDALGRMLAGKN